MFQTGQYVSYGDDGVCRIDGIGPLAISSRYAAPKNYYTLTPLSYKGAIYAPPRVSTKNITPRAGPRTCPTRWKCATLNGLPNC